MNIPKSIAKTNINHIGPNRIEEVGIYDKSTNGTILLFECHPDIADHIIHLWNDNSPDFADSELNELCTKCNKPYDPDYISPNHDNSDPPLLCTECHQPHDKCGKQMH